VKKPYLDCFELDILHDNITDGQKMENFVQHGEIRLHNTIQSGCNYTLHLVQTRGIGADFIVQAKQDSFTGLHKGHIFLFLMIFCSFN
jgi:hypothetical protein